MNISSVTFNEAGAVSYAFDLLRQHLPANRPYHNLWHTKFDVMPAAVRYAKNAGCNPAQISLLRVAAAFHDVGFTVSTEEHEEESINIVSKILPKFDFLPAEIEQIVTMIAGTKLPQDPATPLAEFLADADLDVLGREDFLQRNHALLTELSHYGLETSLKNWYEGQYEFVSNHQYFTSTARALRNPGKEKNLRTLEKLIKQHV